MSLAAAFFDSLPYIDGDPTPAEREAALALIAAEQETFPPRPRDAGEDGLPPPGFAFTPGMAELVARVAATYPVPNPLSAIDVTRYLGPSATNGDGGGGTKNRRSTAGGRDDDEQQQGEEEEDQEDTAAEAPPPPLHRLCAAHAYLASRRANLDLLARHGQTAWLLANYHLEAELAELEAEVGRSRLEVDVLADRRRRAQNDVAAELAGLEGGWRRGVERMVAAQVAVQVARAEVWDGLRRAAAAARA